MTETAKKYGLLAGISVVLYMLLFYVIDKSVMLSMWVFWSSLIIYVVFMAKACLLERAGNNGLLTFKDALRTAFTTFLVANLIFYIFNYLLFNFVDPELVDIQMENARELYPKIMGEKQAKDMLESMTRDGFKLTLPDLIYEYAKGAIGGFMISLLVAGVIRREPF